MSVTVKKEPGDQMGLCAMAGSFGQGSEDLMSLLESGDHDADDTNCNDIFADLQKTLAYINNYGSIDEDYQEMEQITFDVLGELGFTSSLAAALPELAISDDSMYAHTAVQVKETPPPSPTDLVTPSTTPPSTSSIAASTPRSTRQSKGNKPLLADFLYETIENETWNPSIIKWLNKEDGVFLIVKPKQIAELWGMRKGNPKMNYPSMSRGIRERRKYGYFDRVPQGSRYPKKLTYKWGPKAAKFWKEKNNSAIVTMNTSLK